MINKNVLLTLFTRIFIIISGLATSILSARYLGVEGRGSYFFIITLAATISQFANLGLGSSNTYYVARNESISKKLIVNSLWVSVIIGLLASVIVISLNQHSFLNQKTNVRGSLVWYAMIIGPSILFYMLASNILIGLNRIATFNLYQIFYTLLGLLFICINIYVGASLKGFLIASGLSAAITAIFLLFSLGPLKLSELKFDVLIFTKGISFAFKAYLITLLGFLLLRVSIFLITSYHSDIELGYFSIATQIFDSLSIIPTSIALVLFPQLVKAGSKRWDDLKKNIFLISLIMFAAIFITALFCKWFIQTLFGEEFIPSVYVTYYLLPGVLFYSLITVLSQFIAADGMPYQIVIIWVIGLTTVLVLGYLYIPGQGAVGAALAQSIAYFVTFTLMFGLALSRRRNTIQNLIEK